MKIRQTHVVFLFNFYCTTHTHTGVTGVLFIFIYIYIYIYMFIYVYLYVYMPDREWHTITHARAHTYQFLIRRAIITCLNSFIVARLRRTNCLTIRPHVQMPGVSIKRFHVKLYFVLVLLAVKMLCLSYP